MGKVDFAGTWGRRGNTGVFLLVVAIVLIAVVFYAQKWVKSKAPDPDTAMNMSPMREWELRKEKPKPMAELRAEQPKITKTLLYETFAEDPNNQEGRGDLKIMITPDGIVQGSWYGNFYKNKKINCEVQGARSDGKIFPAKIYREGDKEDRTRLYFLTNGRFMVHEADFDTGKYKIRMGDVYIRGWVRQDLSIEGDITTVGDDDKVERFVWRAKPPR